METPLLKGLLRYGPLRNEGSKPEGHIEKCPDCGAEFDTDAAVEKHMKDAHGIENMEGRTLGEEIAHHRKDLHMPEDQAIAVAYAEQRRENDGMMRYGPITNDGTFRCDQCGDTEREGLKTVEPYTGKELCEQCAARKGLA